MVGVQDLLYKFSRIISCSNNKLESFNTKKKGKEPNI